MTRSSRPTWTATELAAFVRQAAAKQGGTPFDPSTIGLDKLDYVAASVSAENDGLRVHGASKGSGTEALGAGDYASKLLDKVPGDALALLDFRGGGISDQLKKLESNPQFAAVAAAAGGDARRLARRPARARAQRDRLLRSGRARGSRSSRLRSRRRTRQPRWRRSTSWPPRWPRSPAASSLREPCARSDLGQFALHYGTSGDHVVITSGVSGIADFGGSGSKLPDSADFKEAKDAAGMPDSTGGFIYVDLKNAMPLIEGFAGLAGTEPAGRRPRT